MKCTIVRWQLSNELDGARAGERRGFVTRHLAGCDDCRAFAVKLERVHGSLTAAAVRAPMPRVAAPSRRPIWLFAATGAFAMMLAWFAMRGTDASDSPPVITTPIASAPQPTEPHARWSTRDLASALHGADPLQRELTALKTDAIREARAALRLPR